MAFPTSVNNQITDSDTEVNTKVIGDAPAVAMGNLYQATSQALANAAHNATSAQQQAGVAAQAATTMGVKTLFSLDTAASGKATGSILPNAGGVDHLNSAIDMLTHARDLLTAAQDDPSGEEPK